MDRTYLHSGWTLRSAGGPDAPDHRDAVTTTVPAEVPGCVHTDLLAAGLIPDPFDGDNETALAWIGRHTWEYRTTLRAAPPAPGERVELVCEGLDTLAALRLDGELLGRTENQFRTYRFDLTHRLTGGEDRERELSVAFSSATDHVERAAEIYGPRPHVNAHPFWALRKMACNFGWDWGPDLVTAGIWRPVSIERWHTARLAAVRPLTTVDGTTGRLTAHLDLAWAAPDAPAAGVTATVRVGERTARATITPGASRVTVTLDVPDAALWYPRGYGDQALHDVEVTLHDAAGALLDRYARRVGFRTVTLDTTPDEHGVPLHITVNGTVVLVRGANWIPDDAFVTRIDAARYRRRVDQAVAADCNLLRVWGGGIYESHAFYDACDELGVLVWQDFLFTCAGYAEEEPLRGEVEAEAREAVTDLSSHASLVLWCGGNETIAAFAEWGWRHHLHGKTWGQGYYEDLLPRVVAELDPTRPYVPNSPYSHAPYASPDAPHLGDMHIWDVWNSKDWTHYADHTPRFASEFGYQGPPSWTALTRVVHDTPLHPDGPHLLVHQKADDGNAKLRRGLLAHFPEPAGFADWHWATQLNQARAIGFGVSHFRSLAPLCTGSVLWQLNDCWPVVSWSVIDGDGRQKPAWYALRHAHADRLLHFRDTPDGLAVTALDDHAEPWRGDLILRAHDMTGAPLGEATVPLDVAPRGTVTLAVPAALAGDGTTPRVVTATAPGARRAVWWSHEDRDSGLPAARLRGEATRTPDGYRVELTADSVVRDLTLLTDRAAPDAEADDALITLLPGERAVVTVRSDREFDPAVLLAAPVLRTANDLLEPAAADDRL
ncbi:glycoside hydrolase family 2 protein [Streptomyces sp. RFCAC02]|uniref:glycoside hydrolase family 2 protein n=1 Tax=Streptomyces sp. RFCAC02 TaxID=2499143 RepID=UPI00101FBBB6|nr:glycoside hydrolase family 2 protein [Streptomyces sp. RFCAC02]